MLDVSPWQYLLRGRQSLDNWSVSCLTLLDVGSSRAAGPEELLRCLGKALGDVSWSRNCHVNHCHVERTFVPSWLCYSLDILGVLDSIETRNCFHVRVKGSGCATDFEDIATHHSLPHLRWFERRILEQKGVRWFRCIASLGEDKGIDVAQHVHEAKKE